MNSKNKDYKAGTYITKKPRKQRLEKMCPICKKCSDRSYCKHRKNIKLMQKCDNCRTCKDKENCDVFYIGEQHRITIPIVVNEETRQTIRKTFSGKTESEAIYNSEKYKKDIANGVTKPEIKQTTHSVVSIIEEYEKQKFNNGITKGNAYGTNMKTLNRIKNNSWAYIPIKKVTRKQVEDFLIKERNDMKSNSVLRKDTRMLKKAFEIAKFRHYIPESFFDGSYGIMTPKSLKPDRKTQAFNIDENQKFLQYLYTHNVTHKNEFLICFYTGLRIGEVLALEVGDIDFKNNCIHITRTTTRNEHDKLMIGPTKTINGERDIVITELLKPILEDAIANRNPSKRDFLFCKPDGSIYSDGALNSALKRTCKKIGITSRVHNHKLRKNFSTRSVEAGVDYKVLEDNLGHADIHETLDTYTDAQKEFKEEELQKYVKSVKVILSDIINTNETKTVTEI